MLTSAKYSQSDLEKHHKTFCGLYNYLIFLRAEDGAQTRDPQLGRLMLFYGCQKLRFRQQPTELLPFTIVIFLTDYF